MQQRVGNFHRAQRASRLSARGPFHQYSVQRDAAVDVMAHHQARLRLIIQAPQEVLHEVAQAHNQKKRLRVRCWRVGIAERPFIGKAVVDAVECGKYPVDERDESAPVLRSFAAEYQGRASVGETPEQEAEEDCVP